MPEQELHCLWGLWREENWYLLVVAGKVLLGRHLIYEWSYVVPVEVLWIEMLPLHGAPRKESIFCPDIFFRSSPSKCTTLWLGAWQTCCHPD